MPMYVKRLTVKKGTPEGHEMTSSGLSNASTESRISFLGGGSEKSG
jgi:hypothetical protein